MSHVSNAVMVGTIAHEIIHAELYRKLKELVDDYQVISYQEYVSLKNNYPGIAYYTSTYGNISSTTFGSQVLSWGLTPNYSEAHHNQMADFYRKTLINTMKSYDQAHSVNRGSNAEEFYGALSWAGLRGFSENNTTQYYDVWEKFKVKIDAEETDILVGQRTYNRYETIIQRETNSSGIYCN